MTTQLEVDDQGRFVHTFRQSTLHTLDTCLERGRLEIAGEMPEEESDAAAVGTACHFGFEMGLWGIKQGKPLSPAELSIAACTRFNQLTALPGFRWVKYTAKRAVELIRATMAVFYDELYHKLNPLLIEHEFGPLVIYEDPERVIRIKGTLDLFDDDHGAVDFKTTGQGRKYQGGFGGEAWMLDRWNIQAPTYIEALLALGYYGAAGPWPFTFKAFDLSSSDVKLHSYTVIRDHPDRAWLREKVFSYAKLIEAQFAPWPKQDNHALCSPKWCPAWGQCKGLSYVNVDWPLKAA